MNKRTLIIIALQAFIIIILFWLLVFYGKDEYEEAMTQDEQEETIDTPSLVQSEAQNSEGIATLTLSDKIQKNSAITTQVLVAANHHASIESLGTVVSLTNLIDVRNRYLTAQNDGLAAKNAVAHSQLEYQRMLALNQDDKNVSDKVLAAAQLALKSDQARLKAAQDTAKLSLDAMRQEWGETLSKLASQTNNSEFDALLQQKTVLVRVSYPYNSPAPSAQSSISLNPVGTNENPVRARYLSIAPQSDANSQGVTYYYIANANTLRAGMRVSVERDDHTQSTSGVIIPHQAIVWHANQAWVYQKKNANTFVRRPVQTNIEQDQGWFTQQFDAGNEIVISGAQLLLSEEFKSQITNENDD